MLPALHKRIGRTALGVVLLLTTQIVAAGQLCHARTMLGSVDTRGVHAMAEARDLTAAGDAGQPCCAEGAKACCADGAMPAAWCVSAPAPMPTLMHDGAVPAFDWAAPFADWLAVALPGSSYGVGRVPTFSVGPPLVAYILFHRFLS